MYVIVVYLAHRVVVRNKEDNAKYLELCLAHRK